MATKFVLKQSSSNPSAKNNPALGEYVFDGSMFTIGSDAANNLVLTRTAAEQAVVVREGSRLTLINSAEGTQINGQNLRREAIEPLTHNDEIRFGDFVVLVIDDETDFPFINTAPEKSPAAESANGTGAKTNPALSAKPGKIENSPAETPRNFADILSTLRTEEDSFYFIVENGAQEIRRVMLEEAEMPLGAGKKGEIAFDIKQISALYAVARKDWSGILLESKRRNSIFVNEEAVETTRRLRNGDRVSFAAPPGFALVLHEPSLLTALEPMLSVRGGVSAAGGTQNGGEAVNQASALTAKPTVALFERRFFGYFSFVEVMTMIIGTLIGAVLFFLFFMLAFS